VALNPPCHLPPVALHDVAEQVPGGGGRDPRFGAIQSECALHFALSPSHLSIEPEGI
jgi:hypothetical protein